MTDRLPRLARLYDAAQDYRHHPVDPGVTCVGTAAAARLLEVSPATVRAMVERGDLPAMRRPGRGTGRGFRIPEWAVVGLREHRQRLLMPGEVSEIGRDRERASVLTDALVALRRADDHAARARELAARSAQEWEEVRTILTDAVVWPLTPSPEEATRPPG